MRWEAPHQNSDIIEILLKQPLVLRRRVRELTMQRGECESIWSLEGYLPLGPLLHREK